MVKLKDAIHNYHIGSMLNVPNPGAPTIQRWKEVITTINNEANRTRLKFLFYTVSMRSMALAIPQVQHIPSANWNGSYF
jgi:hypothetical protein